MNKHTLVVSVLTLLLAACAEDTPNTSQTQDIQPQGDGTQTPVPVVPTTNPDTGTPPPTQPPANSPVAQFPGTTFDPAPTSPPTTSPPTQVPTDPVTPGTGGIDVPEPTEPTEPAPANPGTGDVIDPDSLINGSNMGDVQSAWRCEGATNTDPDKFFLLSFYTDGTGQLEVDGQIAFTRWTLENNQIALREAVPYSVLIYNIEFDSRTAFSADLLVVDTGIAPIDCELVDFNGNLVADDAPQPPAPTTPVTPGSGPDPVEGGNSSTLVNGRTVVTLETLWYCAITRGDELLLGFAADGNGVYADLDFPDGLPLIWSENQSVQIVLDGDTGITLSQPQFGSANDFSVTSITIENENLGGMACDRIDLDGNPIT